ncbi:heme NO-binding domain-containing protein [Desulfovibrio sp. JC022]|uniref:heme NO-binding domain-containing protein n=1 Tax=Desulfovibrio sp. JC022 TaxID=2593642 RepID=UPI0013D176F9|nr:heme NO-binding domain-containing protein [Desulfovibrio sp. JC022]NDV23041.1 heme NO-binding protein [Desulfovibrio sp. JC022]
MYGLVNQGIRKMVTQSFGEETWEAICDKSGVEDVFVAMEPYPDEVTLSLVVAASEVLGLPPEQVLHAFGKWWIGNAAREYKGIFNMTGDSFQEFLGNLNSIHSRVSHMLPKLTPPSFKITDQTDSSLVVHYYSQRQGLSPMVEGMIEGISEWFNTPVKIELIDSAESADHAIFHVSFG